MTLYEKLTQDEKIVFNLLDGSLKGGKWAIIRILKALLEKYGGLDGK